MKKLVLFHLIAVLCLGLCACGGTSDVPESEPTPRPVEYIERAEAKALVEEFIASDTFTALQAEFTRQFDYRLQGPWLEWMVGFAMEDLGGEDVDYLIFNLASDVATADGIIGEWMTVLYDRDTGTWHDSMTTDFESWYAAYTGECKTREDSRNLMLSIDPGPEGSVIYHWQARERWLSQADVAAVNAELGLTKPLPRAEEGGSIQSVIETADSERVALVQQAALAFRANPRWAEMALAPLNMGVAHAMEYKNEELQGQSVHVLLLTLEGVTPELYSPRILVDLADGAVYTEIDLDFEDWGDPRVVCLSGYSAYMEGLNGDIWDRNEARAELTAAELAAVNAALAEAAAQEAVQREEQTQQAAAVLAEGMQRELFSLAVAFRGSAGYAKVADDPGSMALHAAMEYTCEDLEGYPVHVLLLAAEGVDTDSHGFLASMALLDLDTGRIYTEIDLDINNWGDFARVEHAFVAVMGGYESMLNGGQEGIWTEDEICTPVSPEDLTAVNAALALN